MCFDMKLGVRGLDLKRPELRSEKAVTKKPAELAVSGPILGCRAAVSGFSVRRKLRGQI